MRTVIIILVLLLSIVFVSSQTSTAEAELLSLTGSIRPDSALYGLDLALTDLQLSFTTNKMVKAKLLIEVADERFAEKMLMQLRGKNKEGDLAGRDEVKKLGMAKTVIDSVTPEELSKDVDGFEVVKVKLEQRVVVLNRVIEKIRNDGNPSNDKAINSLEEALIKTKVDADMFGKSVSDTRIKAVMGGVVAPGTNMNNKGVYG